MGRRDQTCIERSCRVASFVTLATLGAVAGSASGQTPALVADLVTTPPLAGPSSSPRFPVLLPDGDVLFTVGEFEGRQGVLFRSDGTAAGTRLVDTSLSVRAVPPAASQEPWSSGGGPLCFFNDMNEIWKTDGTSRGTLRLGTPLQTIGVMIVAPRGYSSIVTVPSGRVFWLGASGQRLISSDGQTQDGAAEVFLSASTYSLAFSGWNLAPLGESSVVVAAQPTLATGLEPHITNGTPGGTVALGDLNPGPIGSNPRWFVPFNGRVFFVATDANGTELWSTDGTAAGTQRYADINPGPSSSDPEVLTVSDGRLWFTARSLGQPRRFWHTDGVGAPVEVTGLTAAAYLDGIHRPVPFAGGVTHATTSANGSALHLIRTTGVTRLTPADGSIVHVNSQTGPVVVPGAGAIPDRLYFTGARLNGPTGQELFAATTAQDSAALIADLFLPGNTSSVARPFAPLEGGRLLVTAFVNGDRELYISDGTAAGTTLLANLAITHTNGNPSVVVEGDFPEQAAFTADSTAWGPELFSTDGTSAGTQPIIEFTPGSAGKRRSIFKSDNGWLSLYDGTSTTNKEVRFHGFLNEIGDLLGAVSNFNFQPPAAVNDSLVFTAANGGASSPNTSTAWGAGEAFGPEPLIRIENGGPSNIGRFVRFGDWLYFGADGDAGQDVWRRLYRTDGTGPGTSIVWDQGFGSSGTPIPQIIGLITGTMSDKIILGYNTAFASGIYAHEPASGATTLLLPSMWSESVTFTNIDSALADGVLYFGSAAATSTDYELWRTDGTAAGTFRVRDIVPGGAASRPRNFRAVATPAGQRVYFTAETPQTGRELWVTDGTEAGTGLVFDLFPGPRGSSPTLTFAIAPGTMLFAADDGLTGVELWETDGSEVPPRQLADINPGPEGSYPTNLSVVDGRLWFSATTRTLGRELWSMALAQGQVACDYDFNQDENVDLTDAQQMAQVFVGLITPQAGWLDGDLNGDENADLTDAQLLAAYVVTGVCGV